MITVCVWAKKEKKKEQCTKNVYTVDVMGGQGRAWLICADRRAPLVPCEVVWVPPLTAVHAKLEAMVLRARRGTHQGLGLGLGLDLGDAAAGGRKGGRWRLAECATEGVCTLPGRLRGLGVE
jgi:hypothetical protein